MTLKKILNKSNKIEKTIENFTDIKETIKNSQIQFYEYSRLEFQFHQMVRDYQRDTSTSYVMDYDTWDKLFNALYEQENHIMRYLSKQELMIINETWKIEYEEKDMLL